MNKQAEIRFIISTKTDTKSALDSIEHNKQVDMRKEDEGK